MIISHYEQEIHPNDICGVIVAKQDATKRMIKIFNEGNYFLSMPNIAFRIFYKKLNNNYYLHSCIVAFYNDKKIFHVPLPNINLRGRVCFGHIDISAKNLEDLTKEVINNFWRSNFFINEYSVSYEIYQEKLSTLSNFSHWDCRTRAIPDWIPDRELIQFTDTRMMPIFRRSLKKLFFDAKDKHFLKNAFR